MGDARLLDDRVWFGAAYYAEYQRSPNLDRDMRLMHEAHMNVIRVGEGSWSHWEPEDGVFSLDWLQTILDKAQEYGLHAIIGVPTFAVPQWLARKYPEVAIHTKYGTAQSFGSREEHSLSHPVFRYYAARVIRHIVKRYAGHPAVVGWQLHNEPGLSLNYAHDVFEGFKDYLRHRYHTVEHLNAEWGLTYWSHELSTWDDLWKPEGNAQPQYDLDWRRYQALLTDELLGWQHDLIASLAPPEQFITVNYSLGRDALDEERSSKHLDVVSADLYFRMQNGMRMPNPEASRSWYDSGAWQMALQGDRAYAIKQRPYMIAETNGGPIGGSSDNYPGFHGQWRQAAWQFISRGAEMVEYWHWQQLHYGTETYWGGILPHDQQPGRVYQEIANLGDELERAGDTVLGLRPDADITMLYSVESRWGLGYEPHVAGNPAWGNPQAFDQMIGAFYQAAFESGRQIRFVHDQQLIGSDSGDARVDPSDFVRTNPVLLAVGVYICSDALLDWLRDYVKAGGHLLLGPRTAYADLLARPRTDVKPSRLADLAHARYQEFSNIDMPVKVVGTPEMSVRDGAMATQWIDCLIDEGSQVLATSDDPHFSQFPLVTTSSAGAGKVTVIGTIPNTALAASIYDHVLSPEQWVAAHPSVSHSSAVNSKGERLHFLFNWSWQRETIDLPQPCEPLTEKGPKLTSVTLGPWDVALLKTVSK